MNHKIAEISKELNITDFAIISYESLKKAIKYPYEILKGYPPEIKKYLEEENVDLKNFFPEVKSVIVCIFQYWNSKKSYESEIKKINDINLFLNQRKGKIENPQLIKNRKFKISRYALVDEYHKKIKETLKNMIDKIKTINPETKGKIFVDSSGIFEKQIAAASNLGFYGRNTVLINPVYGSYFFIGGIALNIKLDEMIPSKKENLLCNSCRLCEERCPTKALKDFKIDPSKCISYWTTHPGKHKIPDNLMKTSEYIFGCDICQECCPYNQNIPKAKSIF
ncbi:MAG: DUF1730 domain-containing protein [Elusimicrobiota bacterium]